MTGPATGPDFGPAGEASTKTLGILIGAALILATAAHDARATKWPKSPAAGDVIQDCDECPEMVVVPAGSFRMGSPPSEEGRFDNEGPMRRVTISEPFAVGKYEVTFAEWDACVSAGGCKGRKPDDEGWGRGARPVINVSWGDAWSYALWLSRRTGKEYRLLSEAEWEYAARAGTSTRYSFRGQDFSARRKLRPNRRKNFTGRVVQAERLRFVRHARERVGVGGGLLERRLYGRAVGWERVGERGLRPAGPARRFLVLPAQGPALGVPLLARLRAPVRRHRLPRGPDARPLSLHRLTSGGPGGQSPLVDH